MGFRYLIILFFTLASATTSRRPRQDFFEAGLQYRNLNSSGVTLPLKATYTAAGTILDVEVTVGGQDFLMFLDTGSSDIWLPRTGFHCLNHTDNAIRPQEQCLHDKSYEISPTFRQIENQTFGVKYGSGVASGIVGFERVTIGGLTVERQQIGVADRITDPGNGNDSGVLGLAYPYLTSAHPGSNYPNESYSFWSNRIPYNPLFTNLYEQGSVKPFFALAINRTPVNVSNGDGGFLSLGTTPPVPHKTLFANAPVEIIEAIPPSFTNNETAKTYWALTVKETHVDQERSAAAPFQALVDCGNFFNFVPGEVALSINNAFQPAAVQSADFEVSGLYDVSCNAIAPKFGLTFSNNVTIYMDPKDTLIQNADGTCTSAFMDADILGQNSPITLYVLGTPFLKSVVSIFDFGNDEMRFAERIEGNQLNDPDRNTTMPGTIGSGVSKANGNSSLAYSVLTFCLATIFVL